MPDLEAFSGNLEPGERFERCVSELCRIHAVTFGYAWHSAYLREESSVLDGVMRDSEDLADAMARILTPEDSPRAPLVRGLVNSPTYRALRRSGNLSLDETKTELVRTISSLVGPQGIPCFQTRFKNKERQHDYESRQRHADR